MRPLPSYEEASREIGPYLPHIKWVVEQAFSAFQRTEQLKADNHLPNGPRDCFKPTYVYDMMEQYALQRFDGEYLPAARMYGNLFGIMLCERYFVRFKKLDESLDVTNHASGQNSKYRKQMPFGEFTDEHVYIFAGYRHDGAFTSIDAIHIVCRLNDEVLWNLNLTTMVVEEALTIPFEAVVPKQEQTRRVQLKSTGTDEQQATGITSPLAPTG